MENDVMFSCQENDGEKLKRLLWWHKSGKSAFSLAEVTVVLVIMAGILLLVGRIALGDRQKEYDAKISKLSSTISANITKDLVSNTGAEYGDYALTNGNVYFQKAVTDNLNQVPCNPSECWGIKGGTISIDGEEYDFNDPNKWVFYKLNDKTVMAVSKSKDSDGYYKTDVLIDANGSKAPNTANRDIKAYDYPYKTCTHMPGEPEGCGDYLVCTKNEKKCRWNPVCKEPHPYKTYCLPGGTCYEDLRKSGLAKIANKETITGTPDNKCVDTIKYTYECIIGNGNTSYKYSKVNSAGVNHVKMTKSPTTPPNCSYAAACDNGKLRNLYGNGAKASPYYCECKTKSEKHPAKQQTLFGALVNKISYNLNDTTCKWDCSNTLSALTAPYNDTTHYYASLNKGTCMWENPKICKEPTRIDPKGPNEPCICMNFKPENPNIIAGENVGRVSSKVQNPIGTKPSGFTITGKYTGRINAGECKYIYTYSCIRQDADRKLTLNGTTATCPCTNNNGYFDSITVIGTHLENCRWDYKCKVEKYAQLAGNGTKDSLKKCICLVENPTRAHANDRCTGNNCTTAEGAKKRWEERQNPITAAEKACQYQYKCNMKYVPEEVKDYDKDTVAKIGARVNENYTGKRQCTISKDNLVVNCTASQACDYEYTYKCINASPLSTLIGNGTSTNKYKCACKTGPVKDTNGKIINGYNQSYHDSKNMTETAPTLANKCMYSYTCKPSTTDCSPAGWLTLVNTNKTATRTQSQTAALTNNCVNKFTCACKTGTANPTFNQTYHNNTKMTETQPTYENGCRYSYTCKPSTTDCSAGWLKLVNTDRTATRTQSQKAALTNNCVNAFTCACKPGTANPTFNQTYHNNTKMKETQPTYENGCRYSYTCKPSTTDCSPAGWLTLVNNGTATRTQSQKAALTNNCVNKFTCACKTGPVKDKNGKIINGYNQSYHDNKNMTETAPTLTNKCMYSYTCKNCVYPTTPPYNSKNMLKVQPTLSNGCVCNYACNTSYGPMSTTNEYDTITVTRTNGAQHPLTYNGNENWVSPEKYIKKVDYKLCDYTYTYQCNFNNVARFSGYNESDYRNNSCYLYNNECNNTSKKFSRRFEMVPVNGKYTCKVILDCSDNFKPTIPSNEYNTTTVTRTNGAKHPYNYTGNETGAHKENYIVYQDYGKCDYTYTYQCNWNGLTSFKDYKYYASLLGSDFYSKTCYKYNNECNNTAKKFTREFSVIKDNNKTSCQIALRCNVKFASSAAAIDANTVKVTKSSQNPLTASASTQQLTDHKVVENRGACDYTYTYECKSNDPKVKLIYNSSTKRYECGCAASNTYLEPNGGATYDASKAECAYCLSPLRSLSGNGTSTNKYRCLCDAAKTYLVPNGGASFNANVAACAYCLSPLRTLQGKGTSDNKYWCDCDPAKIYLDTSNNNGVAINKNVAACASCSSPLRSLSGNGTSTNKYKCVCDASKTYLVPNGGASFNANVAACAYCLSPLRTLQGKGTSDNKYWCDCDPAKIYLDTSNNNGVAINKNVAACAVCPSGKTLVGNGTANNKYRCVCPSGAITTPSGKCCTKPSGVSNVTSDVIWEDEDADGVCDVIKCPGGERTVKPSYSATSTANNKVSLKVVQADGTKNTVNNIDKTKKIWCPCATKKYENSTVTNSNGEDHHPCYPCKTCPDKLIRQGTGADNSHKYSCVCRSDKITYSNDSTYPYNDNDWKTAIAAGRATDGKSVKTEPTATNCCAGVYKYAPSCKKETNNPSYNVYGGVKNDNLHNWAAKSPQRVKETEPEKSNKCQYIYECKSNKIVDENVTTGNNRYIQSYEDNYVGKTMNNGKAVNANPTPLNNCVKTWKYNYTCKTCDTGNTSCPKEIYDKVKAGNESITQQPTVANGCEYKFKCNKHNICGSQGKVYLAWRGPSAAKRSLKNVILVGIKNGDFPSGFEKKLKEDRSYYTKDTKNGVTYCSCSSNNVQCNQYNDKCTDAQKNAMTYPSENMVGYILDENGKIIAELKNADLTSKTSIEGSTELVEEIDMEKVKKYGNTSIFGKVLIDGCWCDAAGYARFISPLVLDLEGDGLKFTSTEKGVYFDLDADGTKDKTSWTTKQKKFDNAFLVYDKNGNGQVDNGSELFGDQNGAINGFHELGKYDDDKDGLITPKDSIYNELKLWVDFNKNAYVDSGEFKTLEEMGITEISTSYNTVLGADGSILRDEYGNKIGTVGWFKQKVEEFVDGVKVVVEKTKKMIDVFFQMVSGGGE